MNYNFSYNFDVELNCGIIYFNEKQVLMDFTDTDLFRKLKYKDIFYYLLLNG